MSLVVTETDVEAYNAVFRALLRVCQARWWVDHIWQRFNKTKKYNTPKNAKTKLKQVRLWYQVRQCLRVTMSCS